MEPDFNRIDQNLTHLMQQNAPESDVQKYLQYENVTMQHVIDHKKSFAGKAIDYVGDIGESIATAYRGKQDPKFANVPDFTKDLTDQGILIPAINRGRLVTYSDEAYGDIIEKNLGDRFVKREKDANGYEIITWRGADGEERKGYVNKPGFDATDLQRVVESSAPFMVGGGVAGALTKGRGLIMRSLAQLGAGVTSSLGADYLATGEGSKQSPDLVRAGAAGVGGALFEGLSPAVARAWRKFFQKRAIIDPNTAQLTDKGKAAAIKAGLDPDDMDARLAKEFAENQTFGKDPLEVDVSARTSEFDIPTTAGTRTQDPTKLSIEEQMRKGLLGDQAKDIMTEFDKRAEKALKSAVQENIGKRLAPEQAGTEPATTGGSISNAVRKKLEEARAKESVVWGEAGAAFPTDEGLKTLPKAINKAFEKADYRPRADTDKQSKEMLKYLSNYMNNKLQEESLPLVGGGPQSIFIDNVRRQLLTMYKGAERGTSDAKGAKAIYDGFKQWIQDLATQQALKGRPDAAAKLQIAIDFTKNLHAVFEPANKTGKLSVGGKILKNIIENDTTPERVVNSLFGAGSVAGSPPEGTVLALKHLQRILGPGADWDNVRLAYWVKLAQKNTSNVLSPRQLKTSIDAAFDKQPSVLKELYSPKELAQMRRLSSALEDVIFKPMNPSGSGWEIIRELRKPSALHTAGKAYLKVRQTRATFSQHSFHLARIYQFLASKMPIDFLGLRASMRENVARDATSQAVTQRIAPSFGSIGAATGAELESR